MIVGILVAVLLISAFPGWEVFVQDSGETVIHDSTSQEEIQSIFGNNVTWEEKDGVKIITLTGNVTLSSTVTITGGTWELNLDQYLLSGEDGDTGLSISGGTVTITNGSISGAYGGDGGYNEEFGYPYEGASGSSGEVKSVKDCIFFEEKQGQVYGSASLTFDYTIPADYNLSIPQDTILTVQNGVTLTNNGTIQVGSGTLVNYGKISVSGILDCSGVLYGNKAVYVQPAAPTQSVVTENSITINARVGQNYIYTTTSTAPATADNGWNTAVDTSLAFEDLTSGHTYYIWTYRPENTFCEASSVSSFLPISLAPATNAVTINYAEETISFDSTLEVNTKEDFTGTMIGESNQYSIADYITENETYVYVRVAKNEADNIPESGATKVSIPARPKEPSVNVENNLPNKLQVSYSGNETLEYRIKTNDSDFESWQENGSFTGLRTKDIYTIEARKKATDNAFRSKSVTYENLKTGSIAYEITIPETVTVGEAGKTVSVQSELLLGTGGQLDVRVKSGLNGNGILTLTRENDASGTMLFSQMKVNEENFTDLTKSVAVFKDSDGGAVPISFEVPVSTEEIPAGTYTGTVTFEISYSEQEP